MSRICSHPSFANSSIGLGIDSDDFSPQSAADVHYSATQSPQRRSVALEKEKRLEVGRGFRMIVWKVAATERPNN